MPSTKNGLTAEREITLLGTVVISVIPNSRTTARCTETDGYFFLGEIVRGIGKSCIFAASNIKTLKYGSNDDEKKAHKKEQRRMGERHHAGDSYGDEIDGRSVKGQHQGQLPEACREQDHAVCKTKQRGHRCKRPHIPLVQSHAILVRHQPRDAGPSARHQLSVRVCRPARVCRHHARRLPQPSAHSVCSLIVGKVRRPDRTHHRAERVY